MNPSLIWIEGEVLSAISARGFIIFPCFWGLRHWRSMVSGEVLGDQDRLNF